MSHKITAKHRVITDVCRARDGEEVEEVVQAVREGVKDLYAAWPVGNGTKIHVEVSVEYETD